MKTSILCYKLGGYAKQFLSIGNDSVKLLYQNTGAFPSSGKMKPSTGICGQMNFQINLN